MSYAFLLRVLQQREYTNSWCENPPSNGSWCRSNQRRQRAILGVKMPGLANLFAVIGRLNLDGAAHLVQA